MLLAANSYEEEAGQSALESFIQSAAEGTFYSYGPQR